MKKAISHFSLITCIILTFISNNVNAQSSPVEEVIPPIIDLILNSNSAPINTVPLEPFSPIDRGGFIVNGSIPISVDDPDGNLRSISVVDITNPPLPSGSFNLSVTNSNNITFEANATDAGFTITGPQQDLMTAIEGLIVSDFGVRGTITLLITSIDSEGAADVDTFVVNPTLPPLEANWRPVNTVPLEPVQITNDDLNALATGIQIPFSVTDPNQNLRIISVDIAPQSANIIFDDATVGILRSPGGITIRSSNSVLSAINSLRFTPMTTLSENYTVTVTSTNFNGFSDIDTFEVNFIGEPSTSNSPPVNTAPLEPIQSSSERISAQLSVDDPNGNLNSIRIDITPDFTDKLLIRFGSNSKVVSSPFFNSESPVTIRDTETGLILTGSQEGLIRQIEGLFFIPISKDNYTITMTSTDSEGATDINDFELNLINEQPSFNTPPVNVVPLEPLQIQPNDLRFGFFIDFPFSVNDTDENLTTINVEINPPSATIRLDDPTLDIGLVFPESSITETESGFTIKGANSRLTSIDRLYLTKSNRTESEDYTITVTSTDIEGATDIDTFDVNFTGEP